MKPNGLKFDQYPEIIDVTQMAQMLGIGRNQAYKLIHHNVIPHRDIGRQHRIAKANVIKYIMGDGEKNEE